MEASLLIALGVLLAAAVLLPGTRPAGYEISGLALLVLLALTSLADLAPRGQGAAVRGSGTTARRAVRPFAAGPAKSQGEPRPTPRPVHRLENTRR
ncbi:hypothetical protein ACMA1D_00885 [Streptomyces sp. 796.1]|uniref:hypothetical protein n=1 Tax=Streptomyces sp. 796.1 TaxID=3163029 RepID=UPI0039C93E54